MFHGSIPTAVQQILSTIVKEWNTDEIYVGCSGNFTIERTLKSMTDKILHGNDVTIYSCMLGRYFSGQGVDVEYNENYDGPMQLVKKYMTDDASKVACALLISKMGNYLEGKPNPYYEKITNAYISQWDKLFNKTYEKIEKIEPFLKSFYEGDVCELVDKVPENAGFICYPPFFSGDYEKMFKAIERIMTWHPPHYEMINKDRIFEMFRKLTERECFMFGTDDELPEFKEHLVGLAQTTNRGRQIYIYASSKKSKIVMPSQSVQGLMIPHLGKDEDIGDEMKIVRLASENFHALRSQYMNVNIKPGSETAAYGVCVDNKLIGVYAFSASPTLANWDKHIDTPTMYLLSDFPIAPTKYKRLSKLVLYAALSKESKLLAENLTNHRIRSLITTAFTKRPVSMKYRGLFKLLTKKQLEGTSEDETDMSKIYYNNGYQLNYGAAMGQWTLQEGLEMWKKHHSQTEGRSEN